MNWEITMKQWVIMVMMLLVSLNTFSAERIITLGSDITEMVYELDAQTQLIARDSTSLYPAAALSLPDIGYMQRLNIEGILSLHPTLVIASEFAKPTTVLAQLEKNGVKVINVAEQRSLNAIPEKIMTVAKAVGKVPQGQQQVTRFKQQLTTVKTTPIDKKVLFLMSHGGIQLITAGQDTVADNIITLVGAKNIMSEFKGYRLLSLEGLASSQPDLIIMTKEGIKSLGGVDNVWKLKGLAITPAGKHKALLIVDDVRMLSFSLGTPEVMQQLRDALEKL